MNQSIYTQISKRIGHEGKSQIPGIARAEDLLQRVREEDADAFETVFMIHRFAPTPDFKNEDGQKAMGIIHQAFTEGSTIFQNKH